MLDTPAIAAIASLIGIFVGVLGRFYYVKRSSELTLEVSDRDELQRVRAEMHGDLKELRVEYKAQIIQSIECQLKNAALSEENARLRERVAVLVEETGRLRGKLEESRDHKQ